MKKDKIFPEGISLFSPRENAPDYVLGSVCVYPNELFAWLKKNSSLIKDDARGRRVLRLDAKKSQKGTSYLEVNTYEKDENASNSFKPKINSTTVEEPDDLPY